LDNIAQTATIDYERYENEMIDLSKDEVRWFTDYLYLTWDIWTWTALYSTWSCEASSGLYNEEYLRPEITWEPCRFVLKKWNEWPEIVLLWDSENWSWEYLVSKIKFRVVPYDTSKNIINNMVTDYAPWQPAFWAIGAIYSKFYNPKRRSTSSILPIQLFYGLKWETPSIYS
jgi:hypothetical protein